MAQVFTLNTQETEADSFLLSSRPWSIVSSSIEGHIVRPSFRTNQTTTKTPQEKSVLSIRENSKS